MSRRTRETIALDHNSVKVRSQYDVRFRYLIGKDLVNASVNCVSSLVKPDKGAAFVPDLTGATRRMVSRVCRHGSSEGDNDVGDVNVAARSFVVTASHIRAWKDLAQTDMARMVPDQRVAELIRAYCESRAKGFSHEELRNETATAIAKHPEKLHETLLDISSVTNVIAPRFVCPEYAWW